MAKKLVLFVALVLFTVAVSGVSSAGAQVSDTGSAPSESAVVGVEEQPALYGWDVPPDLPADCKAANANYLPEPGTRVQFGLEERTADEVRIAGIDDSSVSSFGVSASKAEVELLAEAARLRTKVDYQKLRPAMTEVLGDGFIGAGWGNKQGVRIFYKAETDGAALAKAERVIPGGVPFSFEPVSQGVSWSEAVANMKLVGEREDWYGKDGLGSAGLDETCGLVELIANPDADLERLRAEIAEEVDPSEFSLVASDKELEANLLSKSTYHSVHPGGVKIELGAPPCTTNVPWYKTVGNTTEIWAVSAGHCAGNEVASTYYIRQSQWLQGGVRIDDGPGAASVTYVSFGGNLDAAVTRIKISGQRSTHTGPVGGNPDSWQYMAWWQWSPQSPSTSGVIWTDAWGDVVCQSGITANAKWCGILSQRMHAYQHPATGSNFTNLRVTSTNGCQGDSGGTVFRDSDKTLTGIVHAGVGLSTFNHNGQPCWSNIKYSHTGYLKPHFGLKAPVGMS